MARSLNIIQLRSAALLLAITGCNQAEFAGNGAAKEPVEEKFQPPGEELEVKINKSSESVGKADIIFLLDTSASMADEKAKLEQNMAAFMSALVGEYKSVDFQIVMIGQDFAFPAGKTGIEEIVIQQVASHDALAVLQGFLLNPNLTRLQLRADAVKEVIVVSDDNASMNPRDFELWAHTNLNATGKLRINGIVGTDESRQTATCQIASPGTTYKRLEESPVVGGLIQDICAPDWGPLLAALANKIVTNSSKTEFILSKPMRPGAQIQVVINGVVIEQSHLIMDYARNTIVMDGSVVTKSGDKVKVTYVSK
jgi:hypothetical protein